MNQNPYEVPDSQLAETTLFDEHGNPVNAMWRDEKFVFFKPGTNFPDRCFKCNGSTDGYTLKRTLYWHSAWVYLTLLLGPLLYILVGMIIRRKAVIQLPLCPEHRRSRKRMLLSSFALAVLGFVVVFTPFNLFGVWLLIGGIVLSFTGARAVYWCKIDKESVRIGGAKAPFLDSLPEFEAR